MTSTETIATAEFSGPGITPPPEIVSTVVVVQGRLEMSPDIISYAAKVHPSLRTKKAFTVQFSRNDEGFSAYVAELEEYGLGVTRSEALDDLNHTLAELYFSLGNDAHRLSADLQTVWGKLQSHLGPSFQ
jgi:hypothetical protein